MEKENAYRFGDKVRDGEVVFVGLNKHKPNFSTRIYFQGEVIESKSGIREEIIDSFPLTERALDVLKTLGKNTNLPIRNMLIEIYLQGRNRERELYEDYSK